MSEVIRSRQNARVKQATKLRDRRAREKQGRFIIDGARELLQALAAGVDVDEVFVCESLWHGELCQQAVVELHDTRATLLHVTPEVFVKLAFGDRAEGILGVARTPRRTLSDLDLPPHALVAVIEGIEKPGNVGAILRCADGAGVSAVVIVDGGTDLYNPAAIRASLGTVFSVPLCAAHSDQVRRWLIAKRLPLFAARPDGALAYTEANYTAGAAIVLGSEASGLSAVWNDPLCQAIRLPMQGTADSLNVAATAAVIFYEAHRQLGLETREF